jgi:spermidine synthase
MWPCFRGSAQLLVDVGDVQFVDIILEETQERKRVFTAISAVPNDPSCVPSTLEIPWCFMNHSCHPNTHDQWETEIPADLKLAETVATRDIGKNEELTFDYNMEQYAYRSPFECQCGVESCRGTIQGFNGLNREQQKQLLPRTSPFVQEKHRRTSFTGYVDMNPRGRHIVIDYWNCDTELLNNEKELTALLSKAADAAGAKMISTHSHQFEHQGVTAVVILAESHITIHTWPGIGYAGVDIYTCGDCEPLQAYKVMKETLSSDRDEYMELTRGNVDFPHSITAIPDQHLLHSGLSDNDSCFIEGTVPGRRHGNINHGFHISELVLKKHTKFQECLIFDNPVYGRVLVLDGIVQLSTFDEYIYHEMLVHPPMFAHPKPRRVCIVGGGDGGTLREVLRHDPEEVVMIDIDEQFVRSAAEYLPSLSAGAFTDPRVTLLFEDASEALLRYEKSFDVAIIDCNDAIGPSEALFESDFYATVSRALKDDAVCTVQTGSMLDMEFIHQTRDRMEANLGRTSPFKFTMPCYHCGEYVFVVASKSQDPSGPDINRLTELQKQRSIVTKYWSPAIHHASQVFPLTLG